MGRLFTQIWSDWKFCENKIFVCSTLRLNWLGNAGRAGWGEKLYFQFIKLNQEEMQEIFPEIFPILEYIKLVLFQEATITIRKFSIQNVRMIPRGWSTIISPSDCDLTFIFDHFLIYFIPFLYFLSGELLHRIISTQFWKIWLDLI